MQTFSVLLVLGVSAVAMATPAVAGYRLHTPGRRHQDTSFAIGMGLMATF